MTENISLDIKHQGLIINQTESYKYLGLSLNNTLCMTQHIKSSIKKASSRLNLLRKMKIFMDSKTAATIYQSMIVPLLNGCNFATYGATANFLKERIAMFERRASRIIGKEVPDINQMKIRYICSFVHQRLNGTVCETFQSYFELKEQKRVTRNFSAVVVPRFKLESAWCSFYVP